MTECNQELDSKQRHPEGAVHIVEQRTWLFALECTNLLAEGEILGQEF